MQQFRRTLLTVLVLVATATALTGFPRLSSASRIGFVREPVTPPAPPPPGLPDPNSGEPDAGSTRSTRTRIVAILPVDRSATRLSIPTLQVVRWSSIIWVKRILGVVE